MKKLQTVAFAVVTLFILISCSLFTPKESQSDGKLGNVNPSVIDISPTPDAVLPNSQSVDFTSLAEPLNVTVALDDNVTTSKRITANGGRLSLTATDGTVFTLDIPPKALDTETNISMTSVKSVEGAPLDDGSALAVQLEPSGLFFNELVTLTIVPGKEIPAKNQIIFSYEGSGQDYHLAVVDPKSKEIQVKLIEFSGAGIGSGGDAQWAANLAIQASNSRARLLQKFGEATQTDRKSNLFNEDSNKAGENFDSFLDQFYDQVVLKEIVAAELDCIYAQQALEDLIRWERLRGLLGGFDQPSKAWLENAPHLADMAAKCKATYHVNDTPGLGMGWSGDCIDDLSKPFTVFLTGPGTTFTYIISPSSSTSGSLVEKQHVALSGTTMDYEGKGSYTIIPTDKDPEGNLVGMEIDFSTTGNAKSCAEGQCFTNKMESGKGVQIPLRVQHEPCP
jgi:hypothetical protein